MSTKTLRSMSIGESRIIRGVTGDDDVRRRLGVLGFIPGGMITVLAANGGSLIVNVKESRIAVDSDMADRVLVWMEFKVKVLREMKPGESGVVVKVRGEGALKRRIMDMGITKGTEISVVKMAPLGDPIELSVRGYDLSIRKADADLIDVDNCRKAE